MFLKIIINASMLKSATNERNPLSLTLDFVLIKSLVNGEFWNKGYN